MSQKLENKQAIVPLVLLVSTAILWFFQAFMLINAQPFQANSYQMISVSLCIVGIVLSAVLISSKSNHINRKIFLERWILMGLAISILPAIYVFSRSIYVLLAFSGIIGVFFGLGAPVLLGYFASETKGNNRSTISGMTFLIVVLFFNLFQSISSIFIELTILFCLMLAAFLALRITKSPEIHSGVEDLSWSKILTNRQFLFYLLSMAMLMIGIFLVMPADMVFFSVNNNKVAILISATFAGGSAVICGFLGDLFGRKKLLLLGFFLVALSYSTLSIFRLTTYSYYVFLILYYSSLGILYPTFIFTLWGDLSKKNSPEKYYTLGCLPFIIAVALEYLIGTNMVSSLSPVSLFSFVSIFLFAAILPLAYAAEILPSQNRINELNSERQRLLGMLENLPAMVCLITSDYHIAFANRMFREKYGKSEEKTCYRYFEGKERPCEFCEAFQVFKTGKPHHWEVTTKEGSVIDAYDYPFTDVDGSNMVLEVNFDVTERKNLEKGLQEKERLAAIGATAGMVGHDIRNPLQSIVSDVFLLKDCLTSIADSENKEGAKESLENIENNIGYINKIVSDLQDYSKAITPEYSELNLLSYVTFILKGISIQQGILISVEIDREIGIKTDQTFLARILGNLITNAVQAMPQGGKLSVKAMKSSQNITISIEDTGVGIPESVKGKLFTPMMTTKAKGQGLGLAVVKRLVEALDGKISFESEEGKGTKFMIELPNIQ